MHKSTRYLRHRLHYTHFKSIHSQVCRTEKKKMLLMVGQWLQVRDVTDSCFHYCWIFGVFDPLEHSAAKGIQNKPGTLRKGMLWLLWVTLIQQCDIAGGVLRETEGDTLQLTERALAAAHFSLTYQEWDFCLWTPPHLLNSQAAS